MRGKMDTQYCCVSTSGKGIFQWLVIHKVNNIFSAIGEL